MSSSACRCDIDLVDRCAAMVIAQLAGRRQDLEPVLRNAQIQLVEGCANCWPDWRRAVLWVNTYVELAERLERRLARVSGSVRVTREGADVGHAAPGGDPHGLVLFAPAAIGLDQEVVTVIHDSLSNALKPVPKASWMSYRLAVPTTPALVTFDSEKIQDFPELYRHILFGNGRETSRYVHISHPARHALQPLVDLGPAGVYLSLADERALTELASCFVRHLRSFLQLLVTAQISLAARLLHDAVVNETKIFRRNPGLLDGFAAAARKLASLVDPLEIETPILDNAQEQANGMFRQERGGKVLHNICDWMKVFDDDPVYVRRHLSTLNDNLRALSKSSSARDAEVVSAITIAIDPATTEESAANIVEAALRHAKALDHHSVTLQLLLGDSAPLSTITPYNKGGEEGAAEEAYRHLRQAIVRLWSRRASSSLDFLLEKDGTSFLTIKYSRNVGELVAQVLRILGEEWGPRESDEAQDLAGIVRGLRGVPASPEDHVAFAKKVREWSLDQLVRCPFTPVLE